MSSRSLNKVMLIGNLTRDPELRYTPQGTAVCTMGLATNRSWTTDAGEKREETEFHRIVAWNKLAELCAQLLFKGRRIYVEGRLSTRSWVGTDGAQRQATEVVIDDMMILDNKRADEGPVAFESSGASTVVPVVPEVAVVADVPVVEAVKSADEDVPSSTRKKRTKAVASEVKPSEQGDQVNPEDIPF